MMARIGILTCSNCTQDLDCSSTSCLRDFRHRKGAFERYRDDERLDLIGLINCSGCPTLGAPEKILRKVKALADFRVDAIHFTFCLVSVCPFKQKYAQAIQEAYPTIEVVFGTHETSVSPEQFRDEVREMLCASRKTMPDLILGRPGHKNE